MKKKVKGMAKAIGCATAGLLLLLCVPQVHAADDTRSELEQLRFQMEQLMRQNRELGQRINQMEKELERGTTAPPQVDARHQSVIEQEVARQLAEKEEEGGFGLNKHIRLSGLFEGDFVAGKDAMDEDGAHTTEFDLATLELYLDIMVTDWATGRIVIERDADSDDLRADEAYVTLGNVDKFPLFFSLGLLYVPFGDFSTHMLQDPFTQVLGETNDAGAVLGYSQFGLTASVFAYNGMDEEDSDNDTINAYGAALSYGFEDDNKTFNAGVAWISNIADSVELSDYIHDALQDAGQDPDYFPDEISAMAAYVNATWGPFGMIAEYVKALDDFDEFFANGSGGDLEPAALTTELSYTTSFFDLETVFALGYQQSWDAGGFLPEHRYIGVVSFGIFEGTTLSFEYYYDEDYDTGDNGTDNNGHAFTTRVAYEF
ncbi:LbtU family siderophore porin [Desulfosarcina sp. OttesenSCG-928-A07]|nr:LbtU family siderophore porin [Desulfosarcina sp. OttesenSCG-928-G17]MDL2329714.1 LbtU family siderophore porin [Desulfosarcina sp. OttesenSCG-928-A07]